MVSPQGDVPAAARGRANFQTTHWTVVLTARDGGSPGAHEALSTLCETYWYPIYAFIRRRGRTPAEAEDLTQAFFARILAKEFLRDLMPRQGRFRSYLLASLQHFLANEWDRARAQKRGGGKTLLSLDEEDAESRYQIEMATAATPETLYEIRWAWNLLEQVLTQLREEYARAEQSALFDQLKEFITTVGSQTGKYPELAVTTGLKEATLRVAIHRLRRRYGELLRAEIARTVADPAEIEDELRHLIRVLAG